MMKTERDSRLYLKFSVDHDTARALEHAARELNEPVTVVAARAICEWVAEQGLEPTEEPAQVA